MCVTSRGKFRPSGLTEAGQTGIVGGRRDQKSACLPVTYSKSMMLLVVKTPQIQTITPKNHQHLGCTFKFTTKHE